MSQPSTTSRSVSALVRLLTVLVGVLVSGVGLVEAAPVASAQALAVPEGTYRSGSPALVMSGGWTSTRSTMALGGTFSTLTTKGSVSLTFRSSGVSWITRTNAYAGIADVFLDGVKKTSVDLYSSSTKYQQAAYSVSGLKAGTHTVRIVWTGRKNPASRGRGILVDALKVLDLNAPSAPRALTVTARRGAALVDWQPSPQDDVAGYRVYRRQGTAASVLVGTTTADDTDLVDAGVAAAASFRYSVVAVDTSNNASAAASTGLATPAAPSYADRRAASCPTPTVTVANRTQLSAAVASAGPGTVIALSPGRYFSQLDVSVRGSASAPVWICGPRSAVLDGNTTAKGNGVRVDHSAHLVLAGFTVRNSQKGVSVMHSSDVTVADLRVEHIGEEAVHLKFNTVDSRVVGNSIEHTGLLTPTFGEGVYIGSAKPNWCKYNDCAPDRSDRNVIVANDISHTTAEQIEAKEGAVDGTIADNTLDGQGMVPASSDSLIAIQSSGWVITGNRGANAPLDGVQVWAAFEGYGKDNLVTGNRFGGSMPGYAVRLAHHDNGNIVGCDTQAAAGSKGISNKPCQP